MEVNIRSHSSKKGQWISQLELKINQILTSLETNESNLNKYDQYYFYLNMCRQRYPHILCWRSLIGCTTSTRLHYQPPLPVSHPVAHVNNTTWHWTHARMRREQPGMIPAVNMESHTVRNNPRLSGLVRWFYSHRRRGTHLLTPPSSYALLYQTPTRR